jgi:uncharacterized protein (DUF2132 family)
MMLEELVEKIGWVELSNRIRINCFAKDPSVASSLKFLRRTPWARSKVEALFLQIREERQKPNQQQQSKTASASSGDSIWPSSLGKTD